MAVQECTFPANNSEACTESYGNGSQTFGKSLIGNTDWRKKKNSEKELQTQKFSD